MNWFKEYIYIITIVSLVFSSFAFFFSLKNEYEKKFNIEVDFLDESIYEYKINRKSDNIPDDYFQNQFRLIPMILITNNSSYPITITITITELILNNEYKFGFYTKVGESYHAIRKSGAKNLGGGITAFSSGKNHKTLEIKTDQHYILKPPFTIPPFESKTGFIFFHYNSSLIGENKIEFKTSRGSKKVPITIDNFILP